MARRVVTRLMRRRLGLAALGGLVALCLLGWLVGTASAQATGTLDGTVTQGTPGGGSVSGLPVLLLVFKDEQKVDEQHTTTDVNGHFRFEGLDPAPERIYFPVVDYQGVSYYSDPLTFKDSTAQSVQITIYEPTPSDEKIAVPRANMIVTGAEPDRLYLMEMGVVANSGDHTYTGAETLHFPLPAGAENFAPRFGFLANSVSQRPDGFVVNGPVLPGEHQLAYSYELPASGQEVVLTRRIAYPTETFSLFVPLQDGLQVSSPQLSDDGTRDLGGQTYRVFSASHLARGEQVSMRFSGLPAMPGATAQRLGYLLLVAGAAISIAALVFAWRRGATTPAAAPAAEPAAARRERLLDILADLDERYEAGELDQAEYQRSRDVAKRRLWRCCASIPR